MAKNRQRIGTNGDRDPGKGPVIVDLREIGRKGGQSKSKRKREAARENSTKALKGIRRFWRQVRKGEKPNPNKVFWERVRAGEVPNPRARPRATERKAA